MIQLDELPKEVQDRLMLKEQTEQSFENALVEDYTEIMFKTMKERSNPMLQHSYIATMYGQQGSGKSWSALTKCAILDRKFNVDKIYFDVELLVNDRKNLKPNSAVLVDEMARAYGIDSVRISIMVNAIKEQLRKKSIHMIYASPTLKEEYKTCLSKDTIICEKNKGYVKVEDINVGDFVFDDNGKFIKIKNKWKTKRKCYKLKTDFGGEFVSSVTHRFLSNCGLRAINNISVGDFIKISKCNLLRGNKEDYYKGFLYGAFLADGNIYTGPITRISRYTGKRVKSGNSYSLNISNNDYGIKSYLKLIGKKYFNFTSIKIRHSKNIDDRSDSVVFFGKEEIIKIKERFGRILKDKKMCSFKSEMEALGILNGFANCDSGWSLQKATTGLKTKFQICFTISSENIAYGLVDILHIFGVFPVIRKEKRNDGNRDIVRLFIPTLQVEKFIKLLKIHHDKKNRNLQKIKKVLKEKPFLPGNYKRIDKVGFCKVLSKEYVGYKDCVDLEVESNNHLFQLARGIVSHNSMYVLETMFIDKKEKLCFLAYKTNELLTLGYVSIPHPINFVSRNLLLAYEEKKDMHLSNLLDGGVDAVEERAGQVVNNPLFIKAEKMYLQARGYIPYKILVQIVEKIFPEFKGSVIVYEMADRIKANKEISSEWMIFGQKKKQE